MHPDSQLGPPTRQRFERTIKHFRKQWWLVAVVIALMVASALIGGLVLAGWWSVASSLAFSLAGLVIGFYAVTRVIETERGEEDVIAGPAVARRSARLRS